MADDVDLAAPSGTAAADDVGGKLYQKVKAGWGADGTWKETDITSGNPIPIQLRGSDGTDRSNLLPVSISTIAAGDNNIGNVDIVTMPTVNLITGQTAVDGGAGAATAKTLRVTMDSGQFGTLGRAAGAGSVPMVPAHLEYETVAISQTNQMLGATGNVADYIEGLICVVATAATSQVQLKDGNGTAFTVLPANVGGGVGTYYVPLGLKCVNATTPGWQVSTQAGVTVIAVGDFT